MDFLISIIYNYIKYKIIHYCSPLKNSFLEFSLFSSVLLFSIVICFIIFTYIAYQFVCSPLFLPSYVCFLGLLSFILSRVPLKTFICLFLLIKKYTWQVVFDVSKGLFLPLRGSLPRYATKDMQLQHQKYSFILASVCC